MTIYLTGWFFLGLVVLTLAIYRRSLTSHEDLMVHLAAGEEDRPTLQVAAAHKLEIIDRWGKVLTVLLVLYGVAILYAIVAQMWEAQKTMGM